MVMRRRVVVAVVILMKAVVIARSCGCGCNCGSTDDDVAHFRAEEKRFCFFVVGCDWLLLNLQRRHLSLLFVLM